MAYRCLRSYDLAPPPPPPARVSLLDRGDTQEYWWWGARSQTYGRKKAWSSINHSTIFGRNSSEVPGNNKKNCCQVHLYKLLVHYNLLVQWILYAVLEESLKWTNTFTVHTLFMVCILYTRENIRLPEFEKNERAPTLRISKQILVPLIYILKNFQIARCLKIKGTACSNDSRARELAKSRTS